MAEGKRQRQRLILVLRLIAIGDFCAIVAVFLPTSAMSVVHETMGLGALPDEPIVGYLARSASILYALHGAILFYVSLNVDRYESLIRFLGLAIACCGLAFWIVDQFEDLPLWWRIGEGPLVIGLGAVIWWFNRNYVRISRTAEPNAETET
jgi:predicted MFS family arabinose efflux permease